MKKFYFIRLNGYTISHTDDSVWYSHCITGLKSSLSSKGIKYSVREEIDRKDMNVVMCWCHVDFVTEPDYLQNFSED